MTDLTGKVALITGCTRGLGRAIAERYAKLGASIVINHADDDARAREMAAVLEKRGVRTLTVQADVSSVSDIERLFAEAHDKLGAIDIAVANAGVELIDQPCVQFTEADYDRLFSLNTKGALFTMQNAAKRVRDGGRIIYIGSSTTNFALEGCGLYGSSKMAPRYMVEVLAKEIGNRGVTVNSIIPTACDGQCRCVHRRRQCAR